jgi:hypothetical protein
MEIDKSQLVADVAADLWKAGDAFNEKAPLSEQDSMVQFHVKAQVLPVVNATIPYVEQAFTKALRERIESARELNVAPEDILDLVGEEFNL